MFICHIKGNIINKIQFSRIKKLYSTLRYETFNNKIYININVFCVFRKCTNFQNALTE